MNHTSIKTGLAFVIGGVLLAFPAYAVSPLTSDNHSSLLILVEDVENEEVWHDLRPDITPPEAAVGKEGEAPQAAQPERPKEEGKGSGDIEEKEMKEDGLNVPE